MLSGEDPGPRVASAGATGPVESRLVTDRGADAGVVLVPAPDPARWRGVIWDKVPDPPAGEGAGGPACLVSGPDGLARWSANSGSAVMCSG